MPHLHLSIPHAYGHLCSSLRPSKDWESHAKPKTPVITHPIWMRSGHSGHDKVALLPVVIAVIPPLWILWTARGLARFSGRSANNVITRLAIGLRFFVIRFAGFRGLEQAFLTLGRSGSHLRTGFRGGCFLFDVSCLIVGIVVPSNFILGRSRFFQASISVHKVQR